MSKILQIFYISVVAFLCTESFSNTDTNNNYDPSQTPSKHLNGPSQTPDGRSFSVSTNGEPYSVTTNAQSFSILANAQSFSVSKNGEYFSVTTNAPSFSILANGQSFSVSKNGQSLSACISNPSNSPGFPFSPSNSPGVTCSDSNSPALRNSDSPGFPFSDSPGFPFSPSNSFSLSATERTPQLVAQNGRTLFSSSNSNHTTETNELPFFSLDKSNHTSDQNESSNSNHTKDPLKQTLPQSDDNDNDNDNNQNIHLMGAEPTSQEKENSFSSSNSFGHKKNQPENTQEYLSSSRQDYHPSSETAALFSLGNSDSQNSEGTQNSESVGYSRSTNNQGSTSTIKETSDFQQKAKAEPTSISIQDCHPSSETAALFSLGNSDSLGYSDSQRSEDTQNSDSLGYSDSQRSENTQHTEETSVSQKIDKCKKWLLFSAASYIAYCDASTEIFKAPIKSPDEYLKEEGYITKKLSSYVTVFTNEAKKKAIFAICGTNSWYNLRATIGSFTFWGENEYNDTLSHFFPKYISAPYSTIIHANMLCTYPATLFFGYNLLYTQQSIASSFIPVILTSGLYLMLKKNLIPYFFNENYRSYVTDVFDIIKKEKDELIKNGFNDFTLTGHSLGGHVAQFVAAFDREVKVFSISAIGGAHLNAYSLQAWFIKDRKDITLQNKVEWEQRIEGIIDTNDAAKKLSYHGDKDLNTIGTGDKGPLAAHSIANIYRNTYAHYATLCIEIVGAFFSRSQNSSSLSPLIDSRSSSAAFFSCSQNSSSSSPLTDSRSSSAASSSCSQGSSGTLTPVDSTSISNPHMPAATSSDNTQHSKKSWWKIWDWWKDSKTTVDANTPSKKNLWNLYGLLRTRILDMQKIITAN